MVVGVGVGVGHRDRVRARAEDWIGWIQERDFIFKI